MTAGVVLSDQSEQGQAGVLNDQLSAAMTLPAGSAAPETVAP